MKKLFLLLPFLILLKTTSYAETIKVWNYYNSYPFIENRKNGFAKEFTNILNKHFKNKHDFRLQTLPKKRLNKLLSNNRSGLVLFVNPLWMGKNAKEKYLWTDGFMKDKNLVISHIENKIYLKDIKEQKDLKTKENLGKFNDTSFVGIRGRKYKFLSPLIKTQLVDNEKQSLLFLSRQRADFTTQPSVIVKPLIKKLKLENKLFLAPNELFSFERHIMLTIHNKHIYEELNTLISNLPTNEDWKKLLKKYNLN